MEGFPGDREDREIDRKLWQDLEKRRDMENTREICHKAKTMKMKKINLQEEG